MARIREGLAEWWAKQDYDEFQHCIETFEQFYVENHQNQIACLAMARAKIQDIHSLACEFDRRTAEARGREIMGEPVDEKMRAPRPGDPRATSVTIQSVMSRLEREQAEDRRRWGFPDKPATSGGAE